jgi:cytochrome d ubiquinol oxidase subunit II
MKSEAALQERMRHLGAYLAWCLFAVIVVLSAWTPLTQPDIASRWFSLPNLFYFLPVPLLVLASMVGLLRGLRSDAHLSPFLLTLGLIFLSYSGLGISLWPNIIPPSVSIWDAAGPPQSLGFALVGTLFIVPFVLMYTAWAYWVFRGKVRRGDGYH